MADFIQEYFVNPILYQDRYAPYNVYNTAVYAIIAIAAVYFLYRILQKKGVLIDEKFFNPPRHPAGGVIEPLFASFHRADGNYRTFQPAKLGLGDSDVG